MKINITNEAKLAEAINKAQKRAKTRTIEAKDVRAAVEKIEKELRIPKKSMVGIQAEIDANAQDFPKAYKYSPESTVVDVERTASGWVVIDIRRDKTHGKYKEILLSLTDDAKAALAERFAVLSM